MRTISLARKPLVGSVADNVLRFGTAGLNIDASRVRGAKGAGVWGSSNKTCQTNPGLHSDRRVFNASPEGEDYRSQQHTSGRWPPNVILQHRPECQCVGSRQVKGPGWHQTGADGTKGYQGESTFRIREMDGDEIRDRVGWGSDDGKETVEVWDCHPECPIFSVDDQSGPREGCKPHLLRSNLENYDGWGSITKQDRVFGYDDEGGASRFYRQVQGEGTEMSTMPQEMIEYLLTMISPPPPAPRAIFIDLEANPEPDPNHYSENWITGMLVVGKPTEEQVAEFLRRLRPGGHLLLVAPDDEPTGHTGACMIEDAGFEIRDSILWVDEPEGFHYVAKASRSEREAGCDHLTGKSGAEACDRQEDTAGLNNPRAGAGRTAEHVKNFHPTVKPIGLMERLLTDIPTDEGPVLDPFMGSGTTALACVFTGHDFIGIEREEEYLEIADARTRHWEREARCGVVGESPDIISDKPMPRPEMESLDEMFGWGDDD